MPKKFTINPSGTAFKRVQVWFVPKDYMGFHKHQDYHRYQHFGTHSPQMKKMLRVMEAYMKAGFAVNLETYFEHGIEFANLECRP